MIVYHGSNQDIEEIDLSRGSKFKDFGKGFYVTPNLDTAERMARKKVELFKGEPIVIYYEFDESALDASELSVLVYPEKASAEWIRFIEYNRNRGKYTGSHLFDIDVIMSRLM